MLHHFGKQQISHQEEIEAIPYVFDRETAEGMLATERELVESVRRGENVYVNVDGNRTDWHNEDGHAKKHVTQEGAKTVINRERGGG